jgi:hypothetical protein
MHDELSRTVGEWLELCGINLTENRVGRLRNELDKLPYLRFHSKQTSSQCMACQIFKNDRAAQAPHLLCCALPPQTFCSTDQDLGRSVGRCIGRRLSYWKRRELK